MVQLCIAWNMLEKSKDVLSHEMSVNKPVNCASDLTSLRVLEEK